MILALNGIERKINCLLRNQPEGISMAVPMKNGGMKKSKVIYYVILSGITTGIGAFFRKYSGRNITGCNFYMLSIFGRSHDIYSIW